MQQIYRRLPMPKCDLLWNFIEITTRHRCFPVNLLHIFRRLFYKSTYEALLLKHQHILIPITKKRSSKNSKQGWVCISFEESLLLIKSNHLTNLKECLCRSPNQNRDEAEDLCVNLIFLLPKIFICAYNLFNNFQF